MASLTGEEVWRELRTGRWTDCVRLCVHVYCCDSSYLSFILLQSCRCDTGAVVERAGEVWGAPGCRQPPAASSLAGRLPADGGHSFLPQQGQYQGGPNSRRVLWVGWEKGGAG